MEDINGPPIVNAVLFSKSIKVNEQALKLVAKITVKGTRRFQKNFEHLSRCSS